MFRGEVWRINLDPTIGSELRKTRPVVIVSDDKIGILPLKFVVPLTDWKDRYRDVVWMTMVEPNKTNGLTKTSAADAFQVRSVSSQRFVELLGTVETEVLDEITESLAIVLGI